MTRFPLRTRVYAALVALTVLTALFTWWQWDKQWPHEWMPNFIAEWSGLIVAVVILAIVVRQPLVDAWRVTRGGSSHRGDTDTRWLLSPRGTAARKRDATLIPFRARGPLA